jgi:CRP/FNR family cyclic AMP-dependent transcriptional regulator
MRKVLHILGYFNDEDIAWITQVGRRQNISAGQFLIQTSVQLNSIYFVLGGRFNIELPDGTAVAKIKSGEILGEMSFIEEELPSVNVKASEDSSVICIDYEFMYDRFKEFSSFEARFYKAISLFLSSRLRGVAGKLSYGKAEMKESKELKMLESSIDNATLQRIQIAGERFNRLLSHFS